MTDTSSLKSLLRFPVVFGIRSKGNDLQGFLELPPCFIPPPFPPFLVHPRYWPSFCLGTFALAVSLLRTLPLSSPDPTSLPCPIATQFKHHVFRQVFPSCQPFTPKDFYLFSKAFTICTMEYLYIYKHICLYYTYDSLDAHAFA